MARYTYLATRIIEPQKPTPTSETRNALLFERIKDMLSSAPKRVYTGSDLTHLVEKLRADFGFPRSISILKFQRSLIENGIVQEIKLTATYPFESRRYHRDPFSPYELALSLKPGSYLWHGTAAYLHNLTDHELGTVYVNKEQSFKGSEGVLTQTGIKRAFSNKQRQSGYIITHNRTKITLLNGKHSDRLGVIRMTGSYGEQLELTDLERTLSDIAVRPAYAGGPTFVLEAYRRTKSKASVIRVARMLEELEYVYPYHQAIGFYLQSAGYATPKLQVLRKPGIKFDFFLAHGMKRMLFDKEWRIYYPEDLQRRNNIESRRNSLEEARPTEACKKLAEVNRPDCQPRSVSTLGDFVDTRYRKLILPLRKRTTRHGYEVILNHHILPEFKDRQVAEIIHEDVQAFVNRKLKSGAAWNTVKNIVSVFSAVYATAVKYGYVRSNPVRLVEMPSEPVRFQPELPTDEELQRLQNALEEPYQTMVWLGCATGVRVSELLGLRWKSIDWEHKCLWIREAVHNGEVDSPKTHRSCRPIRLARAELAKLKTFRAMSPQAKEDGWVFLNTRGTGPFRADNLLEKVLRPTAKRLGITRVTWHLLRHWHSTVLHDEGVPIKVAQERLGHSRAETTMKHYVHLSQQADADAANAVSRRLRRVLRKAKAANSVSRFVSRNEISAPDFLVTA